MNKKKIVIIIIAVLAAIFLFFTSILCIPIRRAYKDGGTVAYDAILYSVRKVHSLYADGYMEGTQIRILFWTVYDDVVPVKVDRGNSQENDADEID